MEEAYRFGEFFSPSLNDVDFDAAPMVLLLGQYSTGKTSFIKYMLERDFPGSHIGPEPTTDRFMAVMYGKQERKTPGNALAMSGDKPFNALSRFGMNFLNKFEGSECAAPMSVFLIVYILYLSDQLCSLQNMTFIDTPGVLSGEKQRIGRAYDFPEVVEWFAERADRILLLFDAHKLDISDEFKTVIQSLRGHDDKVRIILNKSDVDTQHLMRIYGSLLWSLSRVWQSPEILRVFVSSFTDQEIRNEDVKPLLEAEKQDLISDLRSLPRNSTVRKINEFVKRARMAKVHACIVAHLREQFGLLGKEKRQRELLNNLVDEFKKVQVAHNLPAGDFPNVAKFREIISKHEVTHFSLFDQFSHFFSSCCTAQIWKFPKLDKKALDAMDRVLSLEIPELMHMLPQETVQSRPHYENNVPMSLSSASAPPMEEPSNPFADNPLNAIPATNWLIAAAAKARYDNEFFASELSADEKLSGVSAKKALMKTGVDTSKLKAIWDLSDIDKDGALDCDEFAVARCTLSLTRW